REGGERLLGPLVAVRQIVDRRLPGFLCPVVARVPGVVRGREQRDAGGRGLLHGRGEDRRRAGGHGGLPAHVRAQEYPVLRVVVDRVVVHREQLVPAAERALYARQ